MSLDSESPGVSQAFHVGTSPQSMREAIIALARARDHATTVSKTHWAKIVELSKSNEELIDNNIKLTQRIQTIETKQAIYVAIGSLVGSGLITIAMNLIFK